MNTASLVKKALKLSEAYLAELGLQKPFANKAIDTTDIIADAHTGTVEIEQTYRKQLKIRREVYVVAIELSLTVSGLDTKPAEGGGPSFHHSFEAQLTKFDEFDEEIPQTSPFEHTDNEEAKFVAFINGLPKFKAKFVQNIHW